MIKQWARFYQSRYENTLTRVGNGDIFMGSCKQDESMRSKSLVVAGLIASAGVLPFVVLEAVSTRGFGTHGFPTMLFAALWVLAFVAAHLAYTTLLRHRPGASTSSSSARLVVSTVFLLLVVVAFGSIVVDQMPCFMGVPNCD